jgi:hypothetical protein
MPADEGLAALGHARRDRSASISGSGRGNCRRRHGRRSARSGPSPRCRLASPRRSRRGARSARRHRWTERLRSPAAAPAPPSRRHGAPARAGCGPPPSSAHSKSARRRISRDLAEAFDLLLHASLRAVELEEQHAASRAGRAWNRRSPPFTCTRVEQLDARHRNAGLDRQDGGVARGLRTDGKGQTAAEIASGMPCSFTVISVMMPSVPSEPTKRRVRS